MYTGGERMQLRVASRREHPPARSVRRLVTSLPKNASGEIHTHTLAYRFTNTHTHTYIRFQTHTHTLTRRLTDKHTDLQTHTRDRARAHTCIYMHTPDHWRAVL